MSAPLIEKHAKAIKLRKMGWSYSAIKNEIEVSKSSLSLWLRDYPLSGAQLDMLKSHSEIRIENFRRTMRKKRENRLRNVYEVEKKSLLPITKRELYIAGLMMYWGEGLKASSCTVSVANTDPQVILFIKHWLKECLEVDVSEMRVKLHLYLDMNVMQATLYWSKLLGISG